MLLFKRLVTASFLFIFFVIVLFLGSSLVIGGIVGASAAREARATNSEEGYKIGRRAGEEVGRKYGAIMILGSAVGAMAGACGLSFTGVLPWCRRKPDELV